MNLSLSMYLSTHKTINKNKIKRSEVCGRERESVWMCTHQPRGIRRKHCWCGSRQACQNKKKSFTKTRYPTTKQRQTSSAAGCRTAKKAAIRRNGMRSSRQHRHPHHHQHASHSCSGIFACIVPPCRLPCWGEVGVASYQAWPHSTPHQCQKQCEAPYPSQLCTPSLAP